jgi:hypothetical protein
MDIFDRIATFLIGVASGVAVHYFGNKYTDRRRKQESKKEKKKLFNEAKDKMPGLIGEIKKDLENPEYLLVREFFIISKRNILNTDSKTLVYYYEEHEDLKEKVQILENMGFVTDITPGNCPKYRMTEEFVNLVSKS